MVMKTYYPPPSETFPPAAPTGRREAMHGYDMHDLHQAASTATATKRFLAANRDDLYQAAWDAVVDLLCEAHRPPTWYDLVRAGQVGIQKLRDEFVHTHGYNRATAQVGAAPGFAKYWAHNPLWNSPVEEGVVERVALRQILAALPARQRTALTVRAAADSQQQAADLAGLTYAYMGQAVRESRAAVLALWHEGETPAVKPRTYHQRRAVQHQPCGTPGGYRRHRYRKEQACDDCRAAIAAYAAEGRAARAGTAR